MNQLRTKNWCILAVLLVLLSACATPLSSSAPGAKSTGISTIANDADPAAFPVTLAHKYGSTTITQPPQRIVTVGLTEQDVLLALGITPVGTTEWFGGYPGAIWPWAQDKLSESVPEVVGDSQGVNFEKIATLQPDLILALYAGLTQEQYDLLTQIAPVVAQPAAYVDYGIPWQELAKQVGLAVGKAAEAEQLVATVEARFDQVRTDHPEFDGASALVVTPYQGVWVYGREDVRGRLLTSLGFALPTGLDAITGAQFGSNLSLERVELLDVDALLWIGWPDQEPADGVRSMAVYQNLAVYQEGREVLVNEGDVLGGATSFISVLSLPYLLDNLAPMLAAAVDGDPTTPVVAPSATAAAVSPGATASDDCADGFRSIAHAAGESCIPVNPQRIVTLQDQNGLLPLLELGVTPTGSACHIREDGSRIFRRTEDFDTTAITCVGAYWGEANAEAIALLQPDLIVGYEFNREFYDLHSQIAPTVLVQVFDRPLPVALLEFADLVNRTEQAEALQAAYEERIRGLLAQLGERKAALSISVISAGDEAGQFYRADTGQALGTVMSALDLLRPDAQQGAGSFEPYSIETLPAHDADVVLVINYAGEGQDPNFDAFVNSPLFTSLAAARAEQVYIIDGTKTVGAAWSKMNAFIDELERILLDSNLDVNVVQEATQ